MRRGVRRGFRGVAVVLALTAVACAAEPVAPDEQAKAEALQAAITPLGITITPRVAATLFHTDGGLVCDVARADDDPTASGLLTSHRFALRRTEVRATDVAFVRAVAQVYCPEAAAALDARLAELATEDDE